MAGANIAKERKFHDAWAFYLFIAFAIGMNTFFLVNTKAPVDEVVKVNNDFHLLQCLGVNFLFTICFLMISLLTCFIIPTATIVASVLALPLASIYVFFKYDLATNENAMVFGIIFFVINLLFLIMAGFMVLSNLNYISLALRAASKIFFANFFGVLFLQIVCFIVFAILVAPAGLVNSDDPIIKQTKYLDILLVAWIGSILSYFMEVFISSVVFFQIKNDKDGVFMNSLTNSCYALGSISFGALLVAIVTVLKAMVADAQESQRRDRANRNPFAMIMMWIASILLEILGEIIKFANNIAFPYLSVNGTGYKESIAQSYQLLISSGFEKIAAYYGVGFVITMMTFFSAFSTFVFNTLVLFPKLSVGDDISLIFGIVLSILFGVLFSVVFSLLRSAVMALIYAMVTCQSELKSYDPKFVEAMEQEKKKNVPENFNKQQAA